MADCIQIYNDLTPEAIDCAESMFKRKNNKADEKLSKKKILLGSMAYSTSACYYAAKTPPEAQIESEAGPKAKPCDEPQNLKPMGIPEFTTGGTTLTHLNLAKLKGCVDSVLKIDLVSISNVVDRDCIGWAMQNKGSDPFVVFTAGISMATSTFQTNKRNAEWNTTHYLLVRKKTMFDGGVPKLNVHVLDCDSKNINQESSLYELRTHSDLLGSKSFDIPRVLKKPGRQHFPIIFDTKQERIDDRMKLDIYYEFISLDEYKTTLERTNAKQWFDDDPLENPDQESKKLLTNTQFPDVKLRPLLYFDNKHSSTQGWIHAHLNEHVIIVAFRGASLRDKQNYLTEKDAHLASLEGMDIDDYVLKPTEALAKHEGKKVHHAFRDAYNSMRESLLESVYSVCDWKENWWVVFTGKSFGGAIATLGAYEFANRKVDGKGVQVALMSYGTPRLANPEFVKSYEESVLVSYRFRYNKDPACCYPRKMKHVRTLVTCKTDGSVIFIFPGPEKPKNNADAPIPTQEDQEDEECAATYSIPEVVPVHAEYDFNYASAITIGVKQEFK